MLYKKFNFLIILLICLSILTACRFDKIKDISGSLDKSLVDQVTRTTPNKSYRITSDGGHAQHALELANFFSENDVDIYIHKYCLSSCAEFILVSAHQLYFVDEPIVGFHGNPLLSLMIAHEAESRSGYGDCYLREFEFLANEMRALYSRSYAKISFWRVQQKRLNQRVLDVFVTEQQCSVSQISQDYDLWLPTSDQLEEGLGIKFEGGVCADNFNSCVRKLHRLFPANTHILVGSKAIKING